MPDWQRISAHSGWLRHAPPGAKYAQDTLVSTMFKPNPTRLPVRQFKRSGCRLAFGPSSMTEIATLGDLVVESLEDPLVPITIAGRIRRR
jgi:hypothetical protein